MARTRLSYSAFAGGAFLLGLGMATVPLAVARPSFEHVDISRYPELSADNALPAIFTALRRYLKDPASISDLALCPEPRNVKFKAGRPVRWTFTFSLNAKNAMGGYAGLQHYAAVIYVDKPGEIMSLAIGRYQQRDRLWA